MKKFLAILLAMMLVLVNVAALAYYDADGNELYEKDGVYYTDEATENEYTGTLYAMDEEGKLVPVEDNTPNLAEQATAVPSVAQDITIYKVYTITLPEAILEDSTLLSKYSLTKDSLTFGSDKDDNGKITGKIHGTVVAGSSTATAAPDITVGALNIENEVTILATDIDENGNVTKSFPLTITIPAYDFVGIYEYVISETKGNYQGVGYHTAPLYLRITVAQHEKDPNDDEDTDHLYIAGIALRDTNATDTSKATKIDTLENTYGIGRLSVTKEVTGNMGDQTQDFAITVTFTSDNEVGATITYSGADYDGSVTFTKDATTEKYTCSVPLSIKHGEVVQFENIPAGVSYTVVEDTSDTSAYKTKGYTGLVYENENADIAAADDIAAKVTNTKEQTPDTGIVLETLPFVLLMGIALVGVVALRRREEY